ncbi:MAG: hypothetical protein OEW15_11645 [Nitrospirota bacterium]|nr:hypothetical protein [Nitrospirota bacterium]
MSQHTTATGGILIPAPKTPELNTTPAGLTFVQFVQQLLVGLSTFPGNLVRPEWQREPAKQPDINTDWLAFGLGQAQADFNSYIAIETAEDLPAPSLQRKELVPVSISVYGPNAYDNIGLIRDGFQLTQNLASLRQANIGFIGDAPAIHVPDFFNERWYDRWRMEIQLSRVVKRVYPLLSFVSAQGTIYTQTAADQNYELPFAAEEEA